MMDREKIIKGLELCEIGSVDRCYETECPYYGHECTEGLKKDILELLKEQEALVVREDKVNKCVCGNEINRYWHPEYCGFCGKKLVWY